MTIMYIVPNGSNVMLIMKVDFLYKCFCWATSSTYQMGTYQRDDFIKFFESWIKRYETMNIHKYVEKHMY